MVHQAALCGGVCQLSPTRQTLSRQQSKQTIKTIDNQSRHVSELLVRRINSHQQFIPHPRPPEISQFQRHEQRDEYLGSKEPKKCNPTSFVIPNVLGNTPTFRETVNHNPAWQNFVQPTQEQTSNPYPMRQNNFQSFQGSYNEQTPHYFDNSRMFSSFPSSSHPNPESAMIGQANEYYSQINQTPWQQQFHVRPANQVPTSQFSMQNQRPQNALQQYLYPQLASYEQTPDNLSRQSTVNSGFEQTRLQPIINPTSHETIFDQSIPQRPIYEHFSENISSRQAVNRSDGLVNQRPIQYQQVHYSYQQVQSDFDLTDTYNPVCEPSSEAIAIRQEYLRAQLANTSLPAQIDFSKCFQDPCVGNSLLLHGQQFSDAQSHQPLYGLTPQPSVFIEPQQSVSEQNSRMFHGQIPEQAVNRHGRAGYRC